MPEVPIPESEQVSHGPKPAEAFGSQASTGEVVDPTVLVARDKRKLSLLRGLFRQHQESATPVQETSGGNFPEVVHPVSIGVKKIIQKEVERLKKKPSATSYERIQVFEKEVEVVGDIDQTSLASLTQFVSQENPGVRVGFTKFNVNNLVARRFGYTDEQVHAKEENKNKIVVVNIPGYHPSPTEGTPFTSHDAVTDAVITQIPKITGPIQRGETTPEITMVSVADVAGYGGTVTPEFYAKQQAMGLAAQGEVMAEFLRTHIFVDGKPDKNTLYILQGNSKGAAVARETAKQLSELRTHAENSHAANMQLLLDAPVNFPGSEGKRANIWNLLKGKQIRLGFVLDGIYEIARNPVLREAITKGGNFTKLVRETMITKKFVLDESDEMKKLQKEVKEHAISLIQQPNTPSTEDSRAFVRKGYSDLTTFSRNWRVRMMEAATKRFNKRSKRVEEHTRVIQDGNELVFAVDAGHAVPLARVRPLTAWMRRIGSAMGIDTKQLFDNSKDA